VVVLSWIVAGAATVLGALGVVKLIDPTPTSTMLAALGVPAGNLAARLLGAGEVVLAVVVLSDGPVVAMVALALAYWSFTIGLVVLRRRSPATPCGCVGRWSGPPTRRHIAINGVLASAAVVCVATGTTAWPTLSGPVSTTAYWLSATIASVGVIAAMSSAPAVGSNDARTGPVRRSKP
jgi:hypothetical protein